jgi:hypothetical protein
MTPAIVASEMVELVEWIGAKDTPGLEALNSYSIRAWKRL